MSVINYKYIALLLCIASYTARSAVIPDDSGDSVGLADSVRDEEDTVILVQGSLGPDDFIFYNITTIADPIADEIVSRAILFNYENGNISYIEIYEVGESQQATAEVVSGGLGESGGAIVLRSDLGKGFHTVALIYGQNATDGGETTTSGDRNVGW